LEKPKTNRFSYAKTGVKVVDANNSEAL